MNKGEKKDGKFGTFAGVFTPSILTIFGVIMFMRTSFVVGEAGIIGGIIILLIAQTITFFTSLSVCAISTNMKIEGGGAYYMISRVLGAEFGGAIGVALFLASALSVPFYIIGFTEALTTTFPALAPYTLQIMLATIALLFLITFIGAGLAIKAQYIIMAILLSAIIAFLGGAIQQFNQHTFSQNLKPLKSYTIIGEQYTNNEITELKEKYRKEVIKNDTNQDESASKAENIFESDSFFQWLTSRNRYTFWLIFAIFFPAVTGILTGINMSGDLKEPTKNIPRGTLLAVFIGFSVYLAQMLLCGGAFSRNTLINSPFESLKDSALFSNILLTSNLGGAENLSLGAVFVSAGVMVATLSSALGSFLGAPRVLQALAYDKSIQGLAYFSKGSGKNNEPRRGTVLTFVGASATLLWAGLSTSSSTLNVIAQIVTMFFMITYGTINAAAFLESYSGNPSFRPRFRFFNKYTALLGALGSLIAAILIDANVALVSIILLSLIFIKIKRNKPETKYHDARQGFLFDMTRSNMLKISQRKTGNKNWRPVVLTFTSTASQSAELIRFSSWIESGKGLLYLANIVNTSKVNNYPMARDLATKNLENFCKDKKITAFPLVALADNFKDSYNIILQSVSFGKIKPNIIINKWDKDIISCHDKYKVTESLRYSIVLLKEGRKIETEKPQKRIDIWWRGRKNGNLMVILAHLIAQNKTWSKTDIRLIRVVRKEEGVEPALEALEKLIHDTRMKITPKVIVSTENFNTVCQNNSGITDCTIIGLELPACKDAANWYEQTEKLLTGVENTVLMVDATGKEDVTA